MKLIGKVIVTSKKIEKDKFQIVTQNEYEDDIYPIEVIKADLIITGYELVCKEMVKNKKLVNLIEKYFDAESRDREEMLKSFFNSLEYENIEIEACDDNNDNYESKENFYKKFVVGIWTVAVIILLVMIGIKI